MTFLFIQSIANPDNSGEWLSRWRWDNYWAKGRTRAESIFNLKNSSYH